MIIVYLWQDCGTYTVNQLEKGALTAVSRTYRQANDSQTEMEYTAPKTYPTKKSLEVAAGLTQANMLMRLPLLRVVEKYYRGTLPNPGDCLRHILKEILNEETMLGKFNYRG